MKTVLLTFCLTVCYASNVPKIFSAPTVDKYEPNWDSLDKRPLPKWFDEAKIGIFLHWGVYSVPAMGEWFWNYWRGGDEEYVNFMKKNYPPNFTYQDFARDFTAEFFNPAEWAKLFKKAGAKYVVLTSKHHDGYTLWPSKYSYSWNAKDVGPNRDLVQDLAQAVRNNDLKFGLYHSLYEWFNPLYESDKNSSFIKQEFVDNKMIPEMHEIINKYKPWVLWSDGDWETSEVYFKSLEFLAWLYNESPVKDDIVVNDRWGKGVPCQHGDFYSCADRFNPGTLQPHKWENAMTIDKQSWGFRRNASLSSFLTTFELIKTLAETISCGGNLLINVGPTKDGTIIPLFEERLLDLGTWLAINGEAIYGCKPWKYQNDTLTPGVWYTTNKGSVYAIVLSWPKQNMIYLKSIRLLFSDSSKVVVLLGNEEDTLEWDLKDDVVRVQFPDKATVKSQWAFVLKIT